MTENNDVRHWVETAKTTLLDKVIGLAEKRGHEKISDASMKAACQVFDALFEIDLKPKVLTPIASGGISIQLSRNSKYTAYVNCHNSGIIVTILTDMTNVDEWPYAISTELDDHESIITAMRKAKEYILEWMRIHSGDR